MTMRGVGGFYRARDREHAQQRLHRWLVRCADSEVPELHRLARTIDSWRTDFLAYFDTGGVSNGPTEAMSLLIRKIKRVGHGFHNFENYRLWLLLHCGVDWHTQQPTPLRSWLPATTLARVEPGSGDISTGLVITLRRRRLSDFALILGSAATTLEGCDTRSRVRYEAP